MRNGDVRPLWRDGRLTVMPSTPVRWLPRHGEPFCVIEWLSQTVIRSLAYLPIYTAVVATLTLVIVLVLH